MSRQMGLLFEIARLDVIKEISEHRQKLGLNKSGFAKFLGLKQVNYISIIEKTGRVPSREAAQIIGQKLGYNIYFKMCLARGWVPKIATKLFPKWLKEYADKNLPVLK